MKFKVMSFNLRYDKPDTGNNAWTKRKEAVVEVINHYAPDVIGTQEGQAHQLLDLHRLLPHYQSIGSDRTGTGIGEHCAIFYRTERLRCLISHDFFLSDTPEIPGSMSANWGNPIPRMVSWGEFAIAGEEKTITVFNTHLDYPSEKSRELSVRLIRDRITRLNLAESYVFLTGDFNASPEELPRKTLQHPLSNGINLLDALADIDLEHQLTFHDFTGKAFVAIDTVYYDSRVNLRQATLDTEQWQGIWPSDHFPVVAEFVCDR